VADAHLRDRARPGDRATATVARRIGERDREGAARAATQAIVLSGAIAIVIGIAVRSSRHTRCR
jgi:hypothetical protein